MVSWEYMLQKLESDYIFETYISTVFIWFFSIPKIKKQVPFLLNKSQSLSDIYTASWLVFVEIKGADMRGL